MTFGDNGNDMLKGGLGADVLDGGAGSDTADYRDKTAAVVVTLNGAIEVNVSVGGVIEDTLKRIENAIGGLGADSLTGDGLANALTGGAGNDTLKGGIGNDRLSGGPGKDTLFGGVGNDSFTYALAAGVAQSGITSSTVDTIADWSSPSDSIDTAFAGSASNYFEGSTSATTIEAAAAAAESLAPAGKFYGFLFKGATDTGYLLADLDKNGGFETGIILTGAGAAVDFGFADII